MFRATRTLLSAVKPLRASTGITGLEVNPNALADLKKVYGSTLSLLSTLPATSVYRQATEALTKHRLNAVESAGEDVGKLESGLGNMAEVILEEAKSEQLLAGNMLEWKSWENLEKPAPPNQWRYFDPANPDEL